MKERNVEIPEQRPTQPKLPGFEGGNIYKQHNIPHPDKNPEIVQIDTDDEPTEEVEAVDPEKTPQNPKEQSGWQYDSKYAGAYSGKSNAYKD